MVKFLKLNEVITSTKYIPFIINVDEIAAMAPSNKNTGDTHIRLKDNDKFIFVKESLDEIWAMLNVDKHIEPNYSKKRAL